MFASSSLRFDTLHDVEALNLTQLRELALALADEVALLGEENLMFDHHLKARGCSTVTDADDDDEACAGHQKASLSLEERRSVLAGERERFLIEQSRMHNSVELSMKELRATMEDAMLREKEARLEQNHFAREVLDLRPGETEEELSPIAASALVKYMKDRPMASQQRLKQVRDNIAAAQSKLNRRENTKTRDRGALHHINLDQLRIENVQLIEQLGKKSVEVVHLKAKTTRTVQTLSRCLTQVNSMQQEQAALQGDVRSREALVSRLRSELNHVTADIQHEDRKHKDLQEVYASLRAPPVEEYISQCATLRELRKRAEDWKRKVEIAQGRLATVRKRSRSTIAKPASFLPSIPHVSSARSLGARGGRMG